MMSLLHYLMFHSKFLLPVPKWTNGSTRLYDAATLSPSRHCEGDLLATNNNKKNKTGDDDDNNK